ncbi:MAG: hypothetical protein ACLR08_12565 [Dorea longicatena]
MLSERLLKLPGFLYQIGSNYYYLGKWICKNVQIRMPQTVSLCIRCAGPAVKNLRPALISRRFALSVILH